MQTNDREQFLRVLNGMAAMKKTQLTPESLDLWWACMADWDIADFKAAAIHVLKTTDFMPTPKDFEDLRKAGRMKAGEAWALVLDRVRKGSSRWDYDPPKLNSRFEPPDNPVIDAAVRAIGGYQAIAMHEEATLHFLERRFCEHFESIGEAREIRAAVPAIAGPMAQLAQSAVKRLVQ